MQKFMWYGCFAVALMLGCAGNEGADGTDGADDSGYNSTEAEGDGLGEGSSDPNTMTDDEAGDVEPADDGTDEPNTPEAGSTTGESDESAGDPAGDAAAN